MDSADFQLAADLGREALWMAVKLSFPILAAGLVVGALVSVLQAATQVQDQTLNQVPKMFAIAAVIFALMPWFFTVLAEYTGTLVSEMGTWFR
jgi:flagellar biosynthetic protein FliQ